MLILRWLKFKPTFNLSKNNCRNLSAKCKIKQHPGSRFPYGSTCMLKRKGALVVNVTEPGGNTV